jgi:hypothetical protein
LQEQCQRSDGVPDSPRTVSLAANAGCFAPAPSTDPDELDEPFALLPVQPHDVITSEKRKLKSRDAGIATDAPIH